MDVFAGILLEFLCRHDMMLCLFLLSLPNSASCKLKVHSDPRIYPKEGGGHACTYI